MKRNLMFASAIVLAIPIFVFAQSNIRERQRYEVMHQTTRQMTSLTIAINHYASEHNGKMPPMNNPSVFKKAVRPYTSSDSFVSAATGQPFVPNANLSGKFAVRSNRVVWCYDVKPTQLAIKPPTTYRVVGFSNAVIAMPENRWQRVKKESGIH